MAAAAVLVTITVVVRRAAGKSKEVGTGEHEVGDAGAGVREGAARSVAGATRRSGSGGADGQRGRRRVERAPVTAGGQVRAGDLANRRVKAAGRLDDDGGAGVGARKGAGEGVVGEFAVPVALGDDGGDAADGREAGGAPTSVGRLEAVVGRWWRAAVKGRRIGHFGRVEVVFDLGKGAAEERRGRSGPMARRVTGIR